MNVWGFSMQFYQARHAKQMADLLKQAHAKAAAVSQLAFSSRELFTLDWTNRLLEATWAPALEQILSERLTTTLEVPNIHPVLSPYHWPSIVSLLGMLPALPAHAGEHLSTSSRCRMLSQGLS